MGVQQGNCIKLRRLSLSCDDTVDLNLGFSSALNITDNKQICVRRDRNDDCTINLFYLWWGNTPETKDYK